MYNYILCDPGSFMDAKISKGSISSSSVGEFIEHFTEKTEQL